MTIRKRRTQNGDCDEELMALLDTVCKERGWDFRNYKIASLRRRVSKRLHANHCATFKEYLEVLNSEPSEYDRLFSTVTIKVSEFFREPEVFDLVRGLVRTEFGESDGLRAWSCGCAYGEEPYSVAMVLSECLGPEALKNTKVFATDIDNEALELARKARYKEDSLLNVSWRSREEQFFEDLGFFKVKYNIRNLVKFGRLDIVSSPAIARIQLLFCRNLFIYFNKSLQEAVFAKLDYALRPGGLLVLGKAEVIPSSFQSRYTLLADGMSVYKKTG